MHFSIIWWKKKDVLKPIVIGMLKSFSLQSFHNCLPFCCGKTPFDFFIVQRISFVQKYYILHLTIEVRPDPQVDVLWKRWFYYYCTTNFNSIICYSNFNSWVLKALMLLEATIKIYHERFILRHFQPILFGWQSNFKN